MANPRISMSSPRAKMTWSNYLFAFFQTSCSYLHVYSIWVAQYFTMWNWSLPRWRHPPFYHARIHQTLTSTLASDMALTLADLGAPCPRCVPRQPHISATSGDCCGKLEIGVHTRRTINWPGRRKGAWVVTCSKTSCQQGWGLSGGENGQGVRACVKARGWQGLEEIVSRQILENAWVWRRGYQLKDRQAMLHSQAPSQHL